MFFHFIYYKKLFKLLLIFLRHPGFLLAAVESGYLIPKIFRRYGTRAEWLTFVTDTTVSSLGPLIALRLIDAVRTRFLSEGVDCYLAQGYKRNPPAMKMYEMLDWRIIATFPMHNIYCYSTGVEAVNSTK